MSNWLLILPPGLWGFLVTAVGRWGEHRILTDSEPHTTGFDSGIWRRFSGTLLVNLVFSGILPTFVLFVFQPMLPFSGERAGVALGLAVYVLGLIPARLLDVPRRGWDHAAWMMLIDFLRTVGAMTIAGWLLR
ncbi:MAG: hypothetical protein AB1752_12640 [Candidatus Zixiibacteriota bacterium]